MSAQPKNTGTLSAEENAEIRRRRKLAQKKGKGKGRGQRPSNFSTGTSTPSTPPRPTDTTRPTNNVPREDRWEPVTTADAFMEAFVEETNKLAAKRGWSSDELLKAVRAFTEALVYEDSKLSYKEAGDRLHRLNSTALQQVTWRFVATYRIRAGNPRYYKALVLPGTKTLWFLRKYDEQVNKANQRRQQQLVGTSNN